jgi:hypothetical protein
MAIYVAFWELLIALPEKSDDEIKALLRRANSARYQAPFLFDNVNLPSYLEQLCKQIAQEVVGNRMFVETVKSEAALMSDPEVAREYSQRAARLGVAKLEIPERHLGELGQQFAELKLTDFWKSRRPYVGVR